MFIAGNFNTRPVYHITISFLFQLMLQISFSKLHLTKIVTILPYFTVVNMTSHQLHYMEQDQNTDLWLNIGPKEVSTGPLRAQIVALKW